MTPNPPDADRPSGEVLFGLYGTGGCAREIMPLVVEWAAAQKPASGSVPAVCFVVFKVPAAEVNGFRVLIESEFFGLGTVDRRFNVGIADSRIRKKVAEACLASGAAATSLRSSDAIVDSDSEIGEGAILSARTLVNPNVRIGRFFHLNYYSSVSHDCEIGDFVTFAPGVRCNGNVRISDYAYIGSGAVIRQGTPSNPLTIGEGAVVGMGAVVTKSVPAYSTVVGNPARLLPRRSA